MKVIIAGSRTITDYKVLLSAIKVAKDTIPDFEITEVVSGACQGPDKLGEMYADKHNIQIVQFLPNWKKYGKVAGPKRNARMAKYGDCLIALYDGKSRGTKSMIDLATSRGLQVYVHEHRVKT